MKKTFRALLVLTTFVAAIWMSFWMGFLKSQNISSIAFDLDDQRALVEKKYILKLLTSGDNEKAIKILTEEVALADSMQKKNGGVQPSGFVSCILYAIYPRDGIYLLRIYDYEKKRMPKK